MACRILHMCCVSSRDTSNRSPSIMSSSSLVRTASDRDKRGLCMFPFALLVGGPELLHAPWTLLDAAKV